MPVFPIFASSPRPPGSPKARGSKAAPPGSPKARGSAARPPSSPKAAQKKPAGSPKANARGSAARPPGSPKAKREAKSEASSPSKKRPAAAGAAEDEEDEDDAPLQKPAAARAAEPEIDEETRQKFADAGLPTRLRGGPPRPSGSPKAALKNPAPAASSPSPSKRLKASDAALSPRGLRWVALSATSPRGRSRSPQRKVPASPPKAAASPGRRRSAASPKSPAAASPRRRRSSKSPEAASPKHPAAASPRRSSLKAGSPRRRSGASPMAPAAASPGRSPQATNSADLARRAVVDASDEVDFEKKRHLVEAIEQAPVKANAAAWARYNRTMDGLEAPEDAGKNAGMDLGLARGPYKVTEKMPTHLACQMTDMKVKKMWFAKWLVNGESWAEAIVFESVIQEHMMDFSKTHAWMTRSQACDLYKDAVIGNAVCDAAQEKPKFWKKHPEVPTLKSARLFRLYVAESQRETLRKIQRKEIKFSAEVDAEDAKEIASDMACQSLKFSKKEESDSSVSDEDPQKSRRREEPPKTLPPPPRESQEDRAPAAEASVHKEPPVSQRNLPEPQIEAPKTAYEKRLIQRQADTKRRIEDLRNKSEQKQQQQHEVKEQKKREAQERKEKEAANKETPAGKINEWLRGVTKVLEDLEGAKSKAKIPYAGVMTDQLAKAWKDSFDKQQKDLRKLRDELEECKDSSDHNILLDLLKAANDKVTEIKTSLKSFNAVTKPNLQK